MLDKAYIEDKYIKDKLGKPIYWIKDNNIYKIEDGNYEYFIKDNFIYSIDGERKYSVKDNYIYEL